ncbi:MAG: hypothetical protein JWR07_5256 [Nevskia sp.]|nr:hypothetical protein [Nevskia sp.]
MTQVVSSSPEIPTQMNESEFWGLIDRSRQEAGGGELQAAALTKTLSGLPESDIYAFECSFCMHMMRAYHFDVLAAAKLLEGYVSDDTFIYFRAFLISMGRETLDAAIENADTLVNLQINDGEWMLYVADNALKQKFGEHTQKALPRDCTSAHLNYDFPQETLKGEDWAEQDLERRFPLLWARYSPLA